MVEPRKGGSRSGKKKKSKIARRGKGGKGGGVIPRTEEGGPGGWVMAKGIAVPHDKNWLGKFPRCAHWSTRYWEGVEKKGWRPAAQRSGAEQPRIITPWEGGKKAGVEKRRGKTGKKNGGCGGRQGLLSGVKDL